MIIHKTIFKEMSKNLAVIIFAMSVLLFMEKFVRITRLFMGKGADLSDVIKIFVYIQPSLLLLSLPMAILIAVFLTYGRMATDNEIIVLKSTGMSFLGISGASLALSSICSLVLLFVSLYLLPISMQSLKHTIHETIVKKASMTMEAGTFTDVFKGTTIFVKKIESEDNFKGIFVYRDSEKSMKKPVVIVAKNGKMSSNPEEGLIKLSMNNGLIHSYKEKKSSKITFSTYDFILTSGVKSIDEIKPNEIKTGALWSNRNSDIAWGIELHRRFALPLACIIFGVLGPALSSRIGKIGRIGGFSVSLAILILFYALMIVSEGLAESGKISPFMGGWAADICFGAVAVFFSFFAYKDRPIRKF
jgi:lipopolysaccharide export system permease protein